MLDSFIKIYSKSKGTGKTLLKKLYELRGRYNCFKISNEGKIIKRPPESEEKEENLNGSPYLEINESAKQEVKDKTSTALSVVVTSMSPA